MNLGRGMVKGDLRKWNTEDQYCFIRVSSPLSMKVLPLGDVARIFQLCTSWFHQLFFIIPVPAHAHVAAFEQRDSLALDYFELEFLQYTVDDRGVTALMVGPDLSLTG